MHSVAAGTFLGVVLCSLDSRSEDHEHKGVDGDRRQRQSGEDNAADDQDPTQPAFSTGIFRWSLIHG